MRVHELKSWDEIQPALLDEHCTEIYVIADLTGNGDGANLLKQLESRGLTRQTPKVTWVKFAEKDYYNNRRLELSHVNIICHEGGPSDHDIIEQLMTKIDLEPVERSRAPRTQHLLSIQQELTPKKIGMDIKHYEKMENLAEQQKRATQEQTVILNQAFVDTDPPQRTQDPEHTETGTDLLARLLNLQQEQMELTQKKIEMDKKRYEKMENLAEQQKRATQEQTGLFSLDTGPPQRTQDPEQTASCDKETMV